MNSFQLYLACVQYNREHDHIIPAKSTSSIVRKLDKAEQRRLSEEGRRRNDRVENVLAHHYLHELMRKA